MSRHSLPSVRPGRTRISRPNFTLSTATTNLHYIPREDLIDLSISPGGTDKFDQLSPYLEKP